MTRDDSDSESGREIDGKDGVNGSASVGKAILVGDGRGRIKFEETRRLSSLFVDYSLAKAAHTPSPPVPDDVLFKPKPETIPGVGDGFLVEEPEWALLSPSSSSSSCSPLQRSPLARWVSGGHSQNCTMRFNTGLRLGIPRVHAERGEGEKLDDAYRRYVRLAIASTLAIRVIQLAASVGRATDIRLKSGLAAADRVFTAVNSRGQRMEEPLATQIDASYMDSRGPDGRGIWLARGEGEGVRRGDEEWEWEDSCTPERLLMIVPDVMVKEMEGPHSGSFLFALF
ncbi:hypothetical protein BU17DRAFT_60426 [Hysterangium stoloniferum]|nr:hypothetical protein BU17DRAFT_60426 [Hysterangium stoloniferum]